MTDPDQATRKLGRRMGFLATLAFLGFGWATFDGAITKRDNPNHALTVAPGVDEWVLRRNRTGHYLSPGLINGQPVRFLLDTGATHTSVPAHLAQRLGLQPGVASTVSTANGTVIVRGTRIDALDMGPFRFTGAPAHLNPGMRDDDVLLGMSVLKHLEFTQRGDVLVLRKPAR